MGDSSRRKAIAKSSHVFTISVIHFMLYSSALLYLSGTELLILAYAGRLINELPGDMLLPSRDRTKLDKKEIEAGKAAVAENNTMLSHLNIP